MINRLSQIGNAVAALTLAFGVVWTSAARAQESFAYVVTYIETMPSAEKQAVQLIDRYSAAGRQATGNLRFEALQRIDRPNHFAFVSAWKDQKAAEAYAASDGTKQFREKLQPLLSAPVDERPHSGLEVPPTDVVGSIAPARKAKGAVYAVTHVDLIPPKKDDGIAALKQVTAPSRTEPGSVRYEVLQQNSRPNHLTLVEIWRNHKALETHEVAEHTRKLRDTLLPMGGALYDQRLYTAMD
jgi:quinol monooxygenase YgiN